MKVKSIDNGIGHNHLLLQLLDMTDYVMHSQLKSNYAQNLFKTKSKLLSMANAQVSHELRNPLNSIIAKNI